MAEELILVLERAVEMLDIEDENDRKQMPPGRYEVQRRPNPHGRDANWVVIKGTTTGAAENHFRHMAGVRFEEP